MRVKLSDNAVKRIAKRVEAQFNPQDIDETMEMDEASAEFKKGDEPDKDPIEQLETLLRTYEAQEPRPGQEQYQRGIVMGLQLAIELLRIQ